MVLRIHRESFALQEIEPGEPVRVDSITSRDDVGEIEQIEIIGADAVGILVPSGDSTWVLQAKASLRDWLYAAVGGMAEMMDREGIAEGLPVNERYQRIGDEAYKDEFWASICHRPEAPFFGCAGFMAAAERWYGDNYGKQVVGEIGPRGHVLVELSGAIAGVRIPLVFGHPPFVPIHVDGLGEQAKTHLTENHWARIHGAFHHGLQSLGSVLQIEVRMAGEAATKWSRFLKIAADNYSQSTDAAMEQRFNDAAFMSQQAAEKALKALIAIDGDEPPRTHDLIRLLSMAEERHGHTGISRLTVESASCTMDVRYEVGSVSPSAAVEASRAALEVLGRAATILAESCESHR